MPRLKHSSRAALETLVPRALSEGWTVQALAVACHCGKGAASEALRAHRAAIAARLAQDHGDVVSEMRRVALCERPAVVRRLEAAGAAADSLLAKAALLIEALPPDGATLEGAGSARQESTEERLLKLATVVQKAAAASAQSWKCFKDASGLGLAERVRESEMSAEVKRARDKPRIGAHEVEVIFPDEVK